MNEEDIKFLKSLGYKVKQGNIYKDGKFLSDLTLGNKTFSSLSSEASATAYEEEKKKLKEDGFIYDPTNNQTEYKQRKVFQAKNNLKNYISDADNSPAPDGPHVDEAFDALKKENKFIPDYLSYETFVENNQTTSDNVLVNVSKQINDKVGKNIIDIEEMKRATMEYIDSKEKNLGTRDKIRQDINEEIAQIDKDYENETWKSFLKWGAKLSGKLSMVPHSETSGLGAYKFNENGKIILDIDKINQITTSDGTLGDKTVSFPETDFWGESILKDAHKEEQQNLIKEHNKKKTDYINAVRIPMNYIKTQMEIKRDDALKNVPHKIMFTDNFGITLAGMSKKDLIDVINPLAGLFTGEDKSKQKAQDEEAFRHASNLYMSEIRSIDSFLKNKEYYLPKDDDLTNALTMGWNDVMVAKKNEARIKKKIENNEELTEGEIAVVNANLDVMRSKMSSYEDNMAHTYNITKGFIDSGLFLWGTLPGRVVGGSLSSKIFGGMVKKQVFPGLVGKKFANNLFGKLSKGGINYSTQALLHSNTYNLALNRHTGTIDTRVGPDGEMEFVTNNRMYKEVKEEAEHIVQALDSQVTKLESEGAAEEEIQDLINRKEEVLENLKELKPMNKGQAFLYGFNNTFEENLIEDFGGRLIPTRLLKQGGKLVNKTSLGNSLLNNRVSRMLTKYPKAFNKGFQDLTGGTPRVIGSVPEEMWEEALVQLTPSYGENWTESVKELTEKDFWIQVAGQTVMMSTLFGGVGQVRQYASQDYRGKRRYINNLFKEMQKTDIGEKKLQELLMAGGLKKDFSIQEYNNRIVALRKEGRIKKAGDIEQAKLFNIAMNSIRYGKLRHFNDAVEMAKRNTNLQGSQTMESLLFVQNEIQELKKEIPDVESFINRDNILSFYSKRRYNRKATQDIKDLISKYKTKDKLNETEDIHLQELEGNLTEMEANDVVLSNMIDKLKSPDRQYKLRQKQGIKDKVMYNLSKYGEINDDTFKKVRAKLVSSHNKDFTKKEVESYIDDAISDIKKQKKAQENRAKKKETENMNEDVADKQPARTKEDIVIEVKTKRTTRVQDDVNNVLDKSKSGRNLSYLEKQDQPVIEEDLKKKAKATGINVRTAKTDEVVDNKWKDEDSNIHEDTSTDPDTDPDAIKIKDEKTVVSWVDGNKTEHHTTPKESDTKLRRTKVTKGKGKLFSKLIAIENDFDPNELDALSESIRRMAENYEEDTGEKLTFEKFIEHILSSDQIGGNKHLIKDHFASFGVAWERAELGPSKWKELFEELYSTIKADIESVLDAAKVQVAPDQTRDEAAKQKNKETVEKNSGETPIGTDSNTGEPIKVLSEAGEVTGLSTKVNFSIIEAKEDPQKTTKGTFVRWIKAAIPKMRVFNYIDPRNLINPNRNNVGDKLSVQTVEQEDWGEVDISVRHSNGTLNKKAGKEGLIPFKDWFEQKRQEKNMSDKEFMQTDEFKEKVPIVYVNADGKKVGFVPEVDWFTPLSVRDPNLPKGESRSTTNIDEPGASHKQAIERHKESSRKLRNQIIDKKVTEMTIIEKSVLPYEEIEQEDQAGEHVPLKTLEEVAGDAVLVYMDNGVLRSVHNKEVVISEEQILNFDQVYEQTEGEDEFGTPIAPYVKNGYTIALRPVQMRGKGKNKKMYYHGTDSRRKDENGNNKAFDQDIETIKWLFAANKVLKLEDTPVLNEEHPYHLKKDEAEDIRKQVAVITGGLDIANLGDLNIIYRAMVKYRPNPKESAVTDINGISNFFTSDSGKYEQNTSYSYKNRAVPTVGLNKKTGLFQIDKVADNYDEFLKKRLTTEVMGYNVGTEDNKIFATIVQPTITVVPSQDVEQTLEDKIEEKAKETETKKAISKQKQKVVPKKKLTEDQKKQLEEKLSGAMKFAKTVGIPDRKLGINKSEDEVDRLINPDMKSARKIAKAVDLIHGLTITEEQQVIAKVLGWLSEKGITEQKVSEEFQKKYREVRKKAFEHIRDLKSLPADFVESRNRVQLLIQEFENMAAKADAILQAEERLFNKALRAARENKFITDSFESEIEENVKEYWKTVAEEIPIDKVGVALRRIFAQVDSGKVGVAGTEIHDSFKSMYDTVMAILATNITLEANFNQMISVLETYQEAYPWITKLVAKLKSADNQTQSQFVTNFYKEAVKAKFVAIVEQGTGVITEVWEGNANNIKRNIKEKWRRAFKRTALVQGNKLNTKAMQALFEEWNSFGARPWEVSDRKIRRWLKKFGIIVHNKTWEAIKGDNLPHKLKRWGTISYRKLLGEKVSLSKKDKTGKQLPQEQWKNNSGTLFANLRGFLVKYKDSDLNLDYIEEHPFDDMNNILEGLARLEMKYNPTHISSVRYINKKLLSEIEPRSYFYNKIKELKAAAKGEDTGYIGELLSLSFSKDSYLLKMLNEHPDIADEFEAAVVDKMSMKHLYKKDPLFSDIDELGELDYMFHQRALFQDTRHATIKDAEYMNFKMRLAYMSTPTNSDKGRMMLVKTAAFSLYEKSEEAFEFDGDGNVKFTQKLKDLLYEQLIQPEVRRALKHKNLTDIEGYDKAANRFNLIPGLNTLKGKDERPAILAMGIDSAHDIDTFKENYFGVMTDYLEGMALKEVNTNLSTLSSFEDTVKGQKHDLINNRKYLGLSTGQQSFGRKKLLAELDYTLNAWMSQMNVFQAVVGDPAQYFSYKPEKGGDSKSDLTSQNYDTQHNISKQLADNLGKRMAAMIAPGAALNNANNNQYIQIFLNDITEISENVKDVVGWAYGKKALKEIDKERDIRTNDTNEQMTYGEMIEELKGVNLDGIDKLSREDILLKALKDRFPNIEQYLGIDITDAQEYTTLREHIWVLKNYGRLSDEDVNEIEYALDQYDKTGEFNLPQRLRKTILQPMKPVYTGSMVDKTQDVNRMMYIKSSAFPLIPGLVQGRELDKLRVEMERIERETGKTVRAAHASASKVGGLPRELRVNTASDIETATLSDQNYLTLDRKNFRIQQDVPYKSDKVGDDLISMGTQIFKLLFGDEVKDIKTFELDGKPISSDGLKDAFFEAFSSMVDIKRDKLLKELHMGKDMQPTNSEKSAKALQRLFLREAEARGFSQQDKNLLTLNRKEVEDEQGEMDAYYHFQFPLWFSGNSNKLEAMFNAIINNRIFKQKLPGISFVAGSESGFKAKADLEGIEKSDIITLGDHKLGDALQSTKEEVVTRDGKKKTIIKKAEVYAPSKFKMNGVLINLFEGFDGEKGKYIERIDGVLKIKDDMIEQKAIEQFTFRIPTSSHALAASVQIVGFLPQNSGDLIIAPKSFVAQMGQDFDIDKMNNYMYHHVVLDDGKIRVLSQDTRDQYIKQEEAKIKEAKTRINELRDQGRSSLLGVADPEVLKAFDAILQEDSDITDRMSIPELEERIEEAKSNIKQDFNLKLAENRVIEIHHAIYSNPAMQKRINKQMSTKFAEEQSNMIESMSETKDEFFNVLSPNYQRMKMDLGSTGQIAIGIYAKGLTFHSLARQNTKPIRLLKEIYTKAGIQIVPVTVQIGNIISDGKFGNLKTLTKSNLKDGQTANDFEASLIKYISDVIDEKAQTAVDNEKLQILGKVGLHVRDAIAVDNLLAALGIDTEVNELKKSEYDENNSAHKKIIYEGKTRYYEQYSIPYLLHSQPVIQEFFRRVEEKDAITTPYAANSKETVANEIIREKLDREGTTHKIIGSTIIKNREGQEEGEFLNLNKEAFTADQLITMLQNPGTNPEMEARLLAIYIDLINQAKKQKRVMSVVDTKNLGKSMWEADNVIQNFVMLMAHPEEEFLISNADSMLGSMVDLIGTKANTEEEIVELEDIRQSYEDDPKALPLGGDRYFIPTTPQGKMVGTAISMAENLFTDFFAAKDHYIGGWVDKMVDFRGINRDNEIAVVEAKEYVFQEIKKYVTSATHNGIFLENADEARQDLYMDRTGHKSLSHYIGDIRDLDSTEEQFQDGLDLVKKNDLLSAFAYDIGENGKPSLIKYNTTEVRDYTVEHMYQAFRELFVEDLPLPNKNNEPYSTRKLAQELVAYSFVGGGIVKGAIQFHEFIPYEYYDEITTLDIDGNEITVTEMLQGWDTLNTDWSQEFDNGDTGLTSFTKQYFQNNPDHAPSYSEDFMDKFFDWDDKNMSGFKVNDDEVTQPYVSVRVKTRSKLKANKWKLYQKVGDGRYVRVDVLGDSGMAEYEYLNPDLKSVVVSQTGNIVVPQGNSFHVTIPRIEENKLKELEITEGSNPKDILLRIINDQEIENNYTAAVAETLIGFEPENFKLEIKDRLDEDAFGEAEGSTIRLGKEALQERNDKALTAKVFLHEFIHTLTAREIRKYVSTDFKLSPTGYMERPSAPDAPAAVTDLLGVFNEYINHLEKKYDDYTDFLAEYNKFYFNVQNDLKPDHPEYKPYSFKAFDDAGRLPLYYASVNLPEFVAMVLGDNYNILTALQQMPYRKTGSNILERVAKSIARLLKYIKGSGYKGTFAEEAIVKSISIIEEFHEKKFTMENFKDNTQKRTGPQSNLSNDVKSILDEDDNPNIDPEDEIEGDEDRLKFPLWKMTDQNTLEYIEEEVHKEPIKFEEEQSISNFAKANELGSIQGKYRRRKKQNSYEFIYKEADKRGIKLSGEYITPDKAVIPYYSGKLGVVSFYDNNKKQIGLTENYENLDPLKRSTALAHESIHGIVTDKIETMSEAQVEKLNDQLIEFTNKIKSNEYLKEYAVVDKVLNKISESGPQEIITYAFTNEDFAAALNSVIIDGVTDEKRSFWQRLKELILSVMSDDKTMMDELSEILDEHLSISQDQGPSIKTSKISLADIDRLPKCL